MARKTAGDQEQSSFNKNTLISREEARAIYTTCSVCGAMLTEDRLYVCGQCGDKGYTVSVAALAYERDRRDQLGRPHGSSRWIET